MTAETLDDGHVAAETLDDGRVAAETLDDGQVAVRQKWGKSSGENGGADAVAGISSGNMETYFSTLGRHCHFENPHLEVYGIRDHGIADGITELTNKNGIGIKRGILRNWPSSGLKFSIREKN